MYKRAVFDGSETLKIEYIPDLHPEKGEVLVKIDAAMICGTDVHILSGHYSSERNIALGHEFAGYADELGEGVFACKTGDLVTIEPHIFCGVCKFCRIGKIEQCLNKLAFGVHMNGGFQQYIVVPQNTVYIIPEGVTSQEAAMCEPVGCCLHGLEQADVKFGDSVVILGGGVIGILLMKLAKIRGAAKVIISEPLTYRRELASKYGADHTIDPFSQNLADEVMKFTEGLGADVVIEAAGRPETGEQAVNLVGRGGTVMFFGVTPPDKRITVSPNDIYKRQIKIVGSSINPYAHHRVVQLLEQLKVKELVTHEYSLSEINKAITDAKNSVGLKLCIRPNA